ncbi:ABC transporter ATP-binding protein [Vagococcus silagei]|uniref:ABC transporter ATP-binding protein n=1 Tax=Vagococcus silagei TaxID=2508885 RepID=A0A4S3B7P3_9ENTE|nr:ABC transporter ATP-binding protein [Vagococcus silagei]THB60775.1 ABC transporter ATP-binding protein [Vagococcus silagei]
MSKILEVKNLVKKFVKANGDIHTAVNDISFYLEEGEIFSFLGPNGAGKSTTINMITTQLSITSGEILIDGESIVNNPIAARQKIGVVAQHNNLDRGLSAFENLVYHGKYFGMTQSAAESKAHELLRDFGLADWKDDYVKSFSGGMAQRLKIARAIMHEPKLLFLDEPTTGLDPAYRKILWQHVLRLNKENNTTVFLTTHYMEEPERFSDRIAVYNTGEIKAIGTLAELRKLVPSESIIYVTLDKIPLGLEFRLSKFQTIKNVVKKDEKTLTVYPHDSKKALNEILSYLDDSQLKLENIQLSHTTLDDIFIHLTTENKGA